MREGRPLRDLGSFSTNSIVLSSFLARIFSITIKRCGLARLRYGLTFWLFISINMSIISGGAPTVELNPWSLHTLTLQLSPWSRGLGGGSSFHRYLWLSLWLCFKIWDKLERSDLGREQASLGWCSVTLGRGIRYSYKVLLLGFLGFRHSLTCPKCWVSLLMGDSFLYWMGVLKCGSQVFPGDLPAESWHICVFWLKEPL